MHRIRRWLARRGYQAYWQRKDEKYREELACLGALRRVGLIKKLVDKCPARLVYVAFWYKRRMAKNRYCNWVDKDDMPFSWKEVASQLNYDFENDRSAVLMLLDVEPLLGHWYRFLIR